MAHPDYAGRRVALLTQHGKEQVVRPVLEPGLGCTIEHVTGFDTDLLGTFTGDTPRAGTQLEAARRKARTGMALARSPLGLASEGSFGPDPYTGLFTWNIELLVWLYDERGIEVVGQFQGPTQDNQQRCKDWDEVADFARQAGFPQYRLVMRPDVEGDLRVHKDMADWGQLCACFDEVQAQSRSGQVVVELDLRAFAHPGRMQHIGRAAQDLLRRLDSACPACATPGFWVTERQPGLPCAACGLPTPVHRSETWSCAHCTHRRVVPRTDRTRADPAQCRYCNR